MAAGEKDNLGRSAPAGKATEWLLLWSITNALQNTSEVYWKSQVPLADAPHPPPPTNENGQHYHGPHGWALKVTFRKSGETFGSHECNTKRVMGGCSNHSADSLYTHTHTQILLPIFHVYTDNHIRTLHFPLFSLMKHQKLQQFWRRFRPEIHNIRSLFMS